MQLRPAASGSRVIPRIIAAGYLLLGVACSPGEDARPWLGEVHEVATPGTPGSRYPHLATGPDGTVVMSWLQPGADGGHELRFATWQGSDWSAAGLVAAGRDWFVNWADVPSVVPGADGLRIAHWLQQRPEHVYSYDVRIAVSPDAGRTWSPPLTPHDDGTPTEHGFVTLLPLSEGFLAVWLDGRHTAGGHDHGGGDGGAMTLRSVEFDAAGRPSDAGVELDARVCDCCQTDAALTREGVVVVYRDRSPGEIRDVAVMRRTGDGWSQSNAVHEDGWHMPACPVNGPAIDAQGSEVAVAWFTATDRPRVRLAFSSDAGRSFTAPVEVASGRVAGRVDVVLLDDGRAVVSWLEETPAGAEIRVQPFTRSGIAGGAMTVARSSANRSSGFPRMVRAGNRLVFAWTDATEPLQLRTATAELRH
jgi:hypothetical protein